ncbi:MAG: MFS transporter, partial [Janthinobacterium lividum]
MPEKPRDTLPVMFKELALTSFFAQLSEQIALAAGPLVAVLYLGAGATQTACLQSAQTLPFLLCSMPAGLLVDRLSRRNLMLASECLRALSLFAILYLLQIHHLSLSVLALCGFLGAIGTVVYSVAAPA